MVAGATSGLGLAAAEGFARLGATVWLVVRSEHRGDQARTVAVRQSGSKDVQGGMYTQRIRVNDPQSKRGEFDGPAAYARTKRAQVILAEMWAKRLEGHGIVVHAMHPEFLGCKSTLTYRIVEFDPPRVVTFRGEKIAVLVVEPELAREHGGFEQNKAGRLTKALTPEPTAKAAA